MKVSKNIWFNFEKSFTGRQLCWFRRSKTKRKFIIFCMYNTNMNLWDQSILRMFRDALSRFSMILDVDLCPRSFLKSSLSIKPTRTQHRLNPTNYSLLSLRQPSSLLNKHVTVPSCFSLWYNKTAYAACSWRHWISCDCAGSDLFLLVAFAITDRSSTFLIASGFNQSGSVKLLNQQPPNFSQSVSAILVNLQEACSTRKSKNQHFCSSVAQYQCFFSQNIG